MKDPARLGAKKEWLSCLIGVGLGLAQAGAQLATLTDNNSVARIDLGSQAGMYEWSVQGQNQLYQQWFWYRIGNGMQYSLDTISAPVVSSIGNREVNATYTANNFTVSVNYLLTGGSIVGPGQFANSAIGESIRIVNTSAAALDFHFFQYSDFDLGGPGNDTVQLTRNAQGLFNDAYQTDPRAGLAESVTTPGANHGEVDYYNHTLNRLNTFAGYNLNDVAGPVGPGDVTWGFQWDLNIAPGGSALISKNNYLTVLVPEPAALALASVGAALWALRRRTTPQ